ncbi:MAG TPA: DUF4097 family beta strand repeat-containing protein [Opitutaceae bacterium]
MKTIPVLIAAALAVISSSQLQAEWAHSLRLEGDAPSGRLNISGINGDLTIEGVDGNEINIHSPELETPNQEQPQQPRQPRQDGLRSLLNPGNDNSGLGLQIEVLGTDVHVTGVRPHESASFFFKVPRGMSLQVHGLVHGDVSVDGLGGDMEIVVAEGGIRVAQAASSVVLHSVNGDIDVAYDSYPSNRPSSINAVNGTVRVELPVESKATLELQTINGDIFTDLPVDVKDRNISTWGGPRSILAAMNGGGEKLTVHAINDDVILQAPKN